jgi:hypothetical protein
MRTHLSTDDVAGHERPDLEANTVGEQSAPGEVEKTESNVFQVLGEQARTRSVTQLWVAALGGAVDAVLLWSRHPMLGWIASGCAAVAAYGAWGLLDRAVQRRTSAVTPSKETVGLTAFRDLAAILGTVAALWAVLNFMAVALGNWNH